MRIISAVILMSLMLTGCATPPTAEQIQAADYGAPVYQEEAEYAVKSYFGSYLKDPESARYRFGVVYQGYMITSRLEGAKLQPGYLIEVSVNARNSFGAYVGSKPYRFVIRNDRVVSVWEFRPDGNLIRVMD